MMRWVVVVVTMLLPTTTTTTMMMMMTDNTYNYDDMIMVARTLKIIAVSTI